MITELLENSMCSLLRNWPTVFQSGLSLCIPTSNVWDFLLLHMMASNSTVSVPPFSHSNGCAVVSRWFICPILLLTSCSLPYLFFHKSYSRLCILLIQNLYVAINILYHNVYLANNCFTNILLTISSCIL